MCSLKGNCKYVLGSKGGRLFPLFPLSFFYQSCKLLVSLGRTENLTGDREKASSPALGGPDSAHTGRGTKYRGKFPSALCSPITRATELQAFGQCFSC